MSVPEFVPLTTYNEYPAGEMVARAEAFFSAMNRRRSLRAFSDRPVPAGVLEGCLRAAATAPSAANLQPYHFVVVKDAGLKHAIREAAEAEERAFYDHRATPEWLDVLSPLGTDASKPFLEIAPALIAVFVDRYRVMPDGTKFSHPYAIHSAGIVTGLLIAAIHNAGLVCLTHTPSPMAFLGKLLKRPQNERAFLLLVVGFPSESALVPNIARKSLEELATFE